MLSPNEPLWLALGSAEGQDAGSWLGFLGWELGFLGWELVFFWDGRWVFWGGSQAAAQDPGGTTSSLFTPRHERGRAELVSPVSCGAAATLALSPKSPTCSLPSPLSPQGRARGTAHPVPPRPLHPTGVASPPAARASTPPTATDCPIKSARGTLPTPLVTGAKPGLMGSTGSDDKKK